MDVFIPGWANGEDAALDGKEAPDPTLVSFSVLSAWCSLVEAKGPPI